MFNSSQAFALQQEYIKDTMRRVERQRLAQIARAASNERKGRVGLALASLRLPGRTSEASQTEAGLVESAQFAS